MKKKLLFVCSGNTCRSPLAEAFARRALSAAGDSCWVVESAGIFACDGDPASKHALAVAGEHGLDLSGHRSRRLTPEVLAGADLALVMTSRLKALLSEKMPGYPGKIFTIKEFLGEKGDVYDPFGGSLAEYRAVARELCSLAAGIAQKLRTGL